MLPKTTKKKRRCAGKGGSYERDIARMLSGWWTAGERDDVFWRVKGSGGRAKSRGRKGKGTAGQCGDICATDPIGAPLIDLLTIEIKRGYGKSSIADVLDCDSANRAQQTFEGWLQQTVESACQADSFAWLLITKRDKREPLAFVPYYFYKMLKAKGIFSTLTRPILDMRFVAIVQHKKPKLQRLTTYRQTRIVGMLLSMLLARMSPKIVKQLINDVMEDE